MVAPAIDAAQPLRAQMTNLSCAFDVPVIGAPYEWDTMKTNPRRHDTALGQYMQALGACVPLAAAAETQLALRMRRVRERLVRSIDRLPEPHLGAVLDGADPTPEMAFVQLETIVTRLEQVADLNPGVGLRCAARRARALLDRLAAARSIFITRNLRLAFHFARRMSGFDAPLADLVQAANIGLLEAVDRFDPRRGVRLSSYAGIWITRVILREIPALTQSVRIPDYYMRLRSHLAQTRRTMADELGREPTLQEMATRTDLAENRVRDILQSRVTTVDLDAPRAEGGSQSLADILTADEADSPQSTTILKELLGQLQSMLASLEPRLSKVVRLRYGLGGERPRTLNEIGVMLHLSRERVRQLEDEATALLRTRFQRRARTPRAACPMSA